jgi:hypothetical protein
MTIAATGELFDNFEWFAGGRKGQRAKNEAKGEEHVPDRNRGSR